MVASAPSTSMLSATPAISAAPLVATDVEIRVDGVPPDTTVTADGAPLGTGAGPFKLPKDKPVKLTFAAKGYKPKDMTITPTESTLIPLSLDKAGVPAPPTATTVHHPPTIHKDLDSFDSKN